MFIESAMHLYDDVKWGEWCIEPSLVNLLCGLHQTQRHPWVKGMRHGHEIRNEVPHQMSPSISSFRRLSVMTLRVGQLMHTPSITIYFSSTDLPACRQEHRYPAACICHRTLLPSQHGKPRNRISLNTIWKHLLRSSIRSPHLSLPSFRLGDSLYTIREVLDLEHLTIIPRGSKKR
jgi:hypothetical protein